MIMILLLLATDWDVPAIRLTKSAYIRQWLGKQKTGRCVPPPQSVIQFPNLLLTQLSPPAAAPSSFSLAIFGLSFHLLLLVFLGKQETRTWFDLLLLKAVAAEKVVATATLFLMVLLK